MKVSQLFWDICNGTDRWYSQIISQTIRGQFSLDIV